MSKAVELAELLADGIEHHMACHATDYSELKRAAAELRRLSAEVESLRSEGTAWRVTAENAEKQLEEIEAMAAVPAGWREVMGNLLWAATERDAKNRIRQFDEFVDAAKEMLAAAHQPVAQPDIRTLGENKC